MKGRIIKGIGGLYFVAAEKGVYECQAAGIFRKQKITPVIGDVCEISVIDENERTAALKAILPRNNELTRPRVSNIDQIIVVAAPVDRVMLDKYLAVLESNRLDIIICANKIDIYNNDLSVYANIGYKVIYTSAVTKKGRDDIYACVRSKVSALAGSSGVGKSSIVNMLFGKDIMQTGDLSKKLNKGKHTTRHVELLRLDDNTYILDTPGFSSLTLDGINRLTLKDYFIEFADFAENCAYRDCAHINEPDCKVKAAVGKGIDPGRYENYLGFYRELKG